MSKPLGHHVQTFTGSAVGSVRASPGGILKVLNTAVDRLEILRYRQANPTALILYRHVFPDGTNRDVVSRCDALLTSLRPIEDLVDVVETPWNEEMQDANDLGAYASMTNLAVRIIESHGHSCAIGNFSTSQPKLDDWYLFSRAMVRTARKKYLSVHEYGAPRMQDGDGCLRYRLLHSPLPVLVTECGIDGGVLGLAKKGWRTYTDAQGYAAQLDWYAGEIAKDGVQATPFLTGGFSDWQDFEIAGEGVLETIIDKNQVTPPVTPPITPTYSSPNHGDRRAKTVGIVLHATLGGSATPLTEYSATINWFNDPASQVSAHAVVGPGGRVAYPVDPSMVAWHIKSPGNESWLGIEMCKARLSDPVWPEILDATAKIVATWCQVYKIPIVWSTTHGIAEHREMPGNNHQDVGGPFDRADFLARVKRYAGDDMPNLSPAEKAGALSHLDFLWAYSAATQTTKNPAEAEKVMRERIVALKILLGLQ